MKHILHKMRFTCLLAVLTLLSCSFSALAVDDDTPFFAGRTGSPNVMIILDNSDSMQDSPYLRDDGMTTWRPSDTAWRTGIMVDEDCDNDGNPDANGDGKPDNPDPCIVDNTPGVAGGTIVWDNSKNLTTTAYYTLPAKTAPNLPGLSLPSSTVTSIRNTTTSCTAGMECDNRIYDTNITGAINANTYRYWRVAIRDISAVPPTAQEFNLSTYDTTNKYWNILGGNIEYWPTHTYTYELLSGTPGDVTYKDPSNLTRVYDRNIDWTSIASNWNALYNAHKLKVIAGTNIGEERILTSYDTANGYWTINQAFTLPCDYTTKYQILGVADDSKLASGGNHPESKWYQAKLALTKFLASDSIKTCDEENPDGSCATERYMMNVGLATFIQARVPQTRALYYRKRAGVTNHQFRYYYRQKQTQWASAIATNECTASFTPVSPATFTYNGVSHTANVGYEFNVAVGSGCEAQTVRYRVTSLSCPKPDYAPRQMVVNFQSNTSWTSSPQGTDPDGNPQWGRTMYNWRYYAAGASTDCTSYTPPNPDAGWERVPTGQDCARNCEYIADTTNADYYETSYQTIVGDLRKANPASPGYINPIPLSLNTTLSVNSYVVTPYKGNCVIPGEDWLCTTPNPEDTSGDNIGDYALVESDMVGVPINAAGTLGTIKPVIFDNSIFRIPSWSDATNDHPHGWSYKRTQKVSTATKDDGTELGDHHIYLTGSSAAASNLSKWGDNVQKSPYFPSEPGNPPSDHALSKFSNYYGDDQVFFVDLPEYNAATVDKGDDYTGVNLSKIRAAIGLERVIDPTNANRVFTMAPMSPGSLSVSTEMTVAPQGTPLAASLQDAKKYFESYILQDPFTQGGCRDNYVILLTDGLETGGGLPVTAAENLKNLIVDNKNVGVSVYVIGFGLDRESQTTLNQIAEAGGTSKAYFANNVDDLVTILAHDITEDILGGKYARSSPVVTRAPEEGDEYLTRYDAYFDYPTWRGHLEAWNLDENGKIIGKAAHWASNCSGIPPLTGALPGSADAGCIIAEDRVDPGVSPVGPAALDRRTLYANVQDGVNANGDPNYIKVAFNPTEVAALKSLVNPVDLLVPSAQDVNGDGVIGDDQDAIDVINYIHHPGYDLNKYKGNRDPQWPLADIYNSAPVVVTAPVQGECTGPTGSETWDNMAGYCAFKEAYKNRDTMVYVGTNGGMIEAIAAGRPAKAAVLAADGTTVLEALIPEESGGFEKWGYIPNNVLGNLRGLKDGHKFSMDLPLKASNIDTSPGLDGTGWKTILVAGQRRGGNSYTALDITNPDNPQPLWEFTHPDLGQTWSIPEFGRIVINGVGTSVVFFGGGYSLNADVGNRFFIVRASDGLLIKEFTVGSSVNDVPSGLTIKGYPANKIGQLVDYRTNTPLSPSPACAAVNQSLKLKIETVYFGDTSGTVWRLSDLNNFDPPDDIAQPFGPPWSANLTALYTPDADEQMPIYYRPVVQDIRKGTVNCAGDASGCLRRYILVGTGDEQSPTSTADGLGVPQVNYFFEIEDREFDSAIRDVHTPTWTTDQIAAGAFRLNWRINLGFDLPHDQYGFLLAPNGVRLKKGTQDILNLQTYILNWTVFNDPAQGWSIDGNRSLLKFGNVKAIAGTFLIRHNEGSPHDDNALYNDAVGTFKVADDGTYYLRDLSLWITDRDGCFYDTDGTCLVDTDTYQYDNDGWLTNAGAKVIDPRFNRNVSVISVMGEKVLAAPVSQAGNVFFSTYSPAGGCAMGQSFVYGFAISDCSNLGGEGVLEFDEYGRELLTTRTNLHITGFATGVIASGPYLNLTISGSDGTGDAGEVDHQDIGGSTPTEESVDVPSVCGDDSCDGNENFTSCPEDCTDPQIVAPVDAMKLKYWRQD